MLISIWLFFLICKKIFGKNFFGSTLTAFLGFFLVTNFYVFNLPTLLLAENLTFFLAIYGFYLLVNEKSKFAPVMMTLVGIFLLLVKFSNLPLTLTFYFLYWLKKIKQKGELIQFSLSAISAGVIFTVYYFLLQPKEGGLAAVGGVFSASYFRDHFLFYLKTLAGQGNIFLWFRANLVPSLIGALSMLGIILGIYEKKTRVITFQMVVLIFALIIFMSFFYVIDTRYIFAIYPALLILSGMSFVFLNKKFKQKIVITLMVVIALLILFFPGQGQQGNEVQALTLVKRVVGNVRGNETPWYYVAIGDFNSFFAQPEHKNAYLGTFLPPFFVDFYSRGNFRYLPLSIEQDFFSAKGGLSKDLEIKSISGLYTKLLKKGKKVYVSNVYVTNLPSWVKEFEQRKREFKLNLVRQGCFDACNLYQLGLK